MKRNRKFRKVILAGILVISLLAGCTGAPTNDGTPAAVPEGPRSEAKQEPEVKPEPETSSDAESESKSKSGVLIVYYSATGSTEAVAGYIANATDGDTFAITPAEPYTSDDLNWRNNSSRVGREHDDASLRVMELTETTVDGWEDYDTVFIGYPIWWGIAAWPMDNFVTDLNRITDNYGQYFDEVYQAHSVMSTPGIFDTLKTLVSAFIEQGPDVLVYAHGNGAVYSFMNQILTAQQVEEIMNTTGLCDAQIAYCGRLEISQTALDAYNAK